MQHIPNSQKPMYSLLPLWTLRKMEVDLEDVWGPGGSTRSSITLPTTCLAHKKKVHTLALDRLLEMDLSSAPIVTEAGYGDLTSVCPSVCLILPTAAFQILTKWKLYLQTEGKLNTCKPLHVYRAIIMQCFLLFSCKQKQLYISTHTHPPQGQCHTNNASVTYSWEQAHGQGFRGLWLTGL